MPLVALGSRRPLKVRATQNALTELFKKGFELKYGKVNTGVSSAPFGEKEILRGARNRANAALVKHEAEVSIGIENGLIKKGRTWFYVPAVFVLHKSGINGHSFGAFLPIPDHYVKKVQDEVVSLNSLVEEHTGGERDPHRFFSEGALKREENIAQAILCAFCPILQPQHYKTAEEVDTAVLLNLADARREKKSS